MSTEMIAASYNPNLAVIRTMVRSAYDMQNLRIQMGNRVTASFKAKLGMRQDGMSEKELEKQEKSLLDRLRASYNRITDAIVEEHGEEIKEGKLPTERKFVGDALITHYSELLLLDNYINTLRNEEHHFKDMEKILKKIPVYNEFLTNVRGIGPAMAGIIISEIDITKAEYPSSLWKLAGLDVVWIGKYTDDKGKEHTIRGSEIDAWYDNPENIDKPILAEGKYQVFFEAVGRSRKDFCLVRKTYTNKDGEEAERDSITFNPFLKTKLIGVLGTSFLRAGIATVDGKKMGGARRLELAKEEGFNPKDYVEMDEEQAVIVYLRAKGHVVVVEPSPYAVIYNNYKNRLNNMEQHANKTPLHKHNMAIRYMVKRFLADLYKNWRAIEGLVVAPEYSEGVLGKVHGEAKEAGWQHPRASQGGWTHPRYGA
jgi:hypothetical protein